MTSIIRPSFYTGFARNASQSRRPDLWRGLVGAWKPSLGITGSRLFDISGNGNHGTLTNGVAWAGSERGHVLSFDGVDDYVNPVSSFSLIKSFTVSMWAKNNVGGVNNRLLTNGRGGTNGWGVGFGGTDGQFRFVKNGVVDLNIDIGSFPADLFHVVWVVGSDFNIELYINGISKGKYGNTSTIVADSNNEVLIGADIDSGGARLNYWNGLIDDVRIYNRALWPEEIWGMYINPDEMFLLRRRVSYFVPTAETITVDKWEVRTNQPYRERQEAVVY